MNERDFADKVQVIYVCAEGPNCGRHGMADKTGDMQANTAGGQALYEALKMERTLRGHKESLKVVRTGCQGMCDYAPVATAWPGGCVHHVEVADAVPFLDAVESAGRDQARQVYDLTRDRAANAAAKRANAKP